MTLKINSVFATAIIVVMFILIFASIRGCNNNKMALSQVEYFKERVEKAKNDSIVEAKDRKAFRDTIEFQDGQLSLSANKLSALSEDIEKANKQIDSLIKKHVPLTPNPDTSITTVPNLYINECEECFNSLETQHNQHIKYKAESDNERQLLRSKISVQGTRINVLEKKNDQWMDDYRELVESSNAFQRTLADQVQKNRRRVLYIKMGALAINQYLPNAGGAGFMYQDKKKRIFNIGYYISPQYGPLYQMEIAFPLSFKKR